MKWWEISHHFTLRWKMLEDLLAYDLTENFINKINYLFKFKSYWRNDVSVSK